jgi:hypothetical protein
MTNVQEVESFATELRGEMHQIAIKQNDVIAEQSIVKDELENI